MGLLKKLPWFKSSTAGVAKQEAKQKAANNRQCRFEVMEPRIVLTADPVIAGVTYLEGDAGQDTAPDHFEVTFQGGSDATQLTQFIINGDQDGNGTLSDGDVFFDIGPGLPGTGGSHEFIFDAENSSGISESDVLGVSVSENGLILTVDVQNFEAGDVLAFTIDVDEVENLNIDRIASGVEFEGSQFSTTFEDDNFFFVDRNVAVDVDLESGFTQNQTEGIFYDAYDSLFDEAETGIAQSLDLTRDNETGQGDRTAAAVDAFNLEPRPVTISGTVYEDANLNWIQDSDESGISGVQINLQLLNESTGQYEGVATTTTDANGDYEFGEDLNLSPGNYRIVQVQPDGFIDVGALPGTVEGTETGEVITDSQGNDNILSDINIPLGNTAATDYDFKEVRPASIAGNVYHDRNDDGIQDPGEEGIANVLIRVTRVSASEGASYDPFDVGEPIFVRTDANGAYSVDGLPPGIYEVFEINNDPQGGNPLAGFIDGQDTTGTVDGVVRGVTANEQHTNVELFGGDAGVEYNFGELLPASISGYVSISTPEGDCFNSSEHEGIAGVAIQLFNEDGQLIQETTTNDDGFYEFTNLAPGTYSILEVQPNAFLDGTEHLGNVDGVESGFISANDRFSNIVLTSDSEGVMYNFCEHLPAELHGTVFFDANDNGVQDGAENGIGGVTVELLDANGSLLDSTTTDAQGEYWFTDLQAGTYSVREIQPVAFADGQDAVGTVDGVTVGSLGDDLLTNIELNFGDRGVEYNFGEIQLGSISGMVHGGVDGNCNFNPEEGDQPLAGVVLELLNANGDVIAETVTDADGNYIFEGLPPGTYSVREFTPDGFVDGDEFVGTIDGQTVGTASDDLLASITLGAGDNAINYDFCEHIPAELHGRVFHDLNNDGNFDANEEGIADVLVQLFDENGDLVAEQRTDSAGNYWFTDLIAGTYKLQEIQPTEFLDGLDQVGNVDGVIVGETMADMFTDITLRGGQSGQEYNFGEILPASIAGIVHTELTGDKEFDPTAGEEVIADVTIELLNANGDVVATTTTDQNGAYSFNGLAPGEYSVRQIQPDGFFDGGALAGTGDGVVESSNLISGITLESGQSLVEHNFCEHPDSEIHGRVFVDGPAFDTTNGNLPDGFRDQRDGVFTAGVDRPLPGVEVALYFVNLFEDGTLVNRPVTIGDVLPGVYDDTLGTDPTTELVAFTDSNGEYWFSGLPAGTYAVLETQPTEPGLFDANDIPGTTTGVAINDTAEDTVPQFLLTFSNEQQMDALVGVSVDIGQASFQNNFTEVEVDGQIIFPPPPEPPVFEPPSGQQGRGIQGLPGLAGAQGINSLELGGRSVNFRVQQQAQSPDAYTWHLSVVNGGQPRNSFADGQVDSDVWQQVSFIGDGDWQRFDMASAQWIFTESRAIGDIAVSDDTALFGMFGGTPLAGDFDGDGNDELAVFKDGYWMIDLNHNGRWDDSDLLATLGDADDQPVVGDWDGDGKDDIGIYGPIWERDPSAIAREPGLPNPENDPNTKPKNVPPEREDAANGARVMKLTSYGKQRVDVVDHVFGTGDGEDTAITGDWNGNGIRSIGYFNDGYWQFDTNGDGRFDYQDENTRFGQAGDIPLVGDFNGDGVEEIAVYRSGTWLIDTNGNRELDATDKTFELGGAADKPVVGDWDGDGLDEPAIYRQSNGNQY